MKERARELKAEARADKDKAQGESDVLAKIAEMPDPERAMASRLHALIKANAPGLLPKTWYGMPAYANKDGKIAGPELDACLGLKAALMAMRTDPVRGANASQIATRINQWKDSRVRRFPLCCLVTHAGQPLANGRPHDAGFAVMDRKALFHYRRAHVQVKSRHNTGEAVIAGKGQIVSVPGVGSAGHACQSRKPAIQPICAESGVEFPSHGRSPIRSCLPLVLCQSERSFGMLISLRLPVSYTGLSPDKFTPMPGVPSHGGEVPYGTRLRRPPVRSVGLSTP